MAVSDHANRPVRQPSPASLIGTVRTDAAVSPRARAVE